ncbi:MAG TPA: type 4a pilus biogenesis protein PilO [Gaiellaceae bacterium]
MKIPRPLPKAAVIGGIAAAGLLVVVVGWLVLVGPQNHKAASLTKQTADVEKQITDQLAQIAAAKNVTAAPQVHVADVYKLAKAMPSMTDMPNILIQLDQVAKDSGVQLQNIAPSQPSLDPATGQQAVQVTLNVNGDFYTLTDLLYRLRNFVYVRHGALEASGRLFTIDNVSFSPLEGHQLTASIGVRTYVYGAAAAAPAAAAPPATDTSTDTTSTTTDTTSSDAPSAAGSGGE